MNRSPLVASLHRVVAVVGPLARSRVDLWVACALLVVGIVVRFAVIVIYDSPARHDFSDMGTYLAAARQIAEHRYELSQFFQGIGYPLLLAVSGVGGNAWTAIALLHFLASVLTLLLAWRCAAQLTGERVALFALGVMALDIPLIGIGAFAMPETVYALCVTGALWCWLKRDAQDRERWLFGLGVAIAFGAILKGTLALILLPLAAYIFAFSRKRLHAGARVAAGLGVILIPLALFAHASYGTYKVGADNAGFSFMDGKCPWKDNSYKDGSHWLSPLNVQLGEQQARSWDVPFSNSGYYFRVGLRCIADQPVEVVRSLRYLYYLFFDNEVWPVNEGQLAVPSRVAMMVWRAAIFPGLLAGLLALAFSRKRARWIWLAMALTPCVLAYVFKAEARYRLPFDAVFVALSAYGWQAVARTVLGGPPSQTGNERRRVELRRWEPRGRSSG